jgi:hypothetical protein
MTDTQPDGLDLSQPSIARMYNRYIGGAHNTELDRTAAADVLRVFPEAEGVARDNRELLGRVVRHLLDNGIRQFLDLGSGVPATGAVHEIVDRYTHGSGEGRVVYVDTDLSAITAVRCLRDDNEHLRPWVGAVHADVRYPDVIVADEQVQQLLDLTQPVGVLLFAVLHFVGGEDDVVDLVGRYRRMIPVGSYVAATQIGNDDAPDADAAQRSQAAVQVYWDNGIPVYPRTRAEVAEIFDGLDLDDQGVVHPPHWRPGDPTAPNPDRATAAPFAWCGVAKKGPAQ